MGVSRPDCSKFFEAGLTIQRLPTGPTSRPSCIENRGVSGLDQGAQHPTGHEIVFDVVGADFVEFLRVGNHLADYA